MKQAFVLPIPRFKGSRRAPESDFFEEREAERIRLEYWSAQLDRLIADKSHWDYVVSELRRESNPLEHPALRAVSRRNEQTLLHLAVLDDRIDVLSLQNLSSEFTEKRNALGFSPIDLAHFLHKRKSASLLTGSAARPDFLSQPGVEFADREQIAALDLEYLPQPIFESADVMDDMLFYNLKAKQEDAIPHDRIWMGIYYDSEIQTGRHPGMEVRWIDKDVGFGVFAGERVLPCSFIGEYTGIIQRRTHRKVRESGYVFRYTSWCIGKTRYIADAERMGNFTRFINHSDRPNAALVCAYWRGLPRLLFISLQEISKGAQITFDYGRTYWRQSPYIKKRML